MLSRRKARQPRDDRALPGLPPILRGWLFLDGAAKSSPVVEINTALTKPGGVPRTIPLMPDDPLRVENLEGSRDGRRILRLTGPLTLSNLFEFQSLVRAEKAPVVIIDLTNVPYVDSAGIGSLMGAHVARQKDGRALALVGVNKRVKDALEVTRVFSFFRVYPSVAEAESALPYA